MWNGIQRGQSSGIEMISALSADHVLRRNIRIISQSKEHTPTLFVQSLHGSHHVRLQDSIALLWNSIIDQLSSKQANGLLPRLPNLRVVASGEKFGLVPSEYSSTFGGLYIKDEPDDDNALLDLPSQDPDAQEATLRALNIDPYLAYMPAQSVRHSQAVTPSPIQGSRTPSPDPIDGHQAGCTTEPGTPARQSSPELEIIGESTAQDCNEAGARKRKIADVHDSADVLTDRKKFRIEESNRPVSNVAIV